ncbi:MAG: GNAT family N-acetyltransferase, partial [Planctomycetaceae bacterium]
MTPLIDYRTFHNGDVPALVSLWKRAGLGPGAAVEVSCDSFDLAVFAQIYFDPKGLIFALHAGELVGFAHAGFAANEDWTGLE